MVTSLCLLSPIIRSFTCHSTQVACHSACQFNGGLQLFAMYLSVRPVVEAVLFVHGLRGGPSTPLGLFQPVEDELACVYETLYTVHKACLSP